LSPTLSRGVNQTITITAAHILKLIKRNNLWLISGFNGVSGDLAASLSGLFNPDLAVELVHEVLLP
jgi:hypothetical protein